MRTPCAERVETRKPWRFPKWMVGPTLAESEAYQAAVRAEPDMEPMMAALPEQEWSVVVYGFASMNTRITARTAEEAEHLAIVAFEEGTAAFDEPMFGFLDADAELAARP